MSFLAPLSLALGAAAAVAIYALHLLTTRRPPPMPLPTARFVPPGEARAVARAKRPTDVPLMLLRMLAVLLVGAAFARPVIDAAGPSVRTVVLLERSRAVADAAAAAALARTEVGEGGAVVVFGDSARAVPLDSLEGLAAASVAAGSLSAAFVAARGAAATIAPGADSLRLVVVGALTAGSVDAATPTLRAAWPGRVEIRRVASVADTAVGPRAELRSPLDDDPLAPAVERLGGLRGGHEVRIVRGPLAPADSAWVRGGAGRVLVEWRAQFGAAAGPLGATAFGSDRAANEASTRTIVAPLARLPLDSTDVGAEAGIIARWNDGAPAAIQRPLHQGCVRTIGIGIPLAGDLTLREPFTELLAALTEPCDGLVGAALPDDALGWLTGDTPTLAPARLLAASDDARRSRLPAYLLALALLALIAEQLLRRRAVVNA